ncbi:MAG: hypothetical protein JWP61_1665 [Friedmanniella sp.]|nr:hypothetical protein [Friedmanniella sp.]
MSGEAVSDESVARALGAYAGMVHRVLADPSRWLGLDSEPGPGARFPAKALDAVRDRVLGETTPASPGWAALPLEERDRWWVRRIGVTAGVTAAAPRFAGALADRLPLVDALGAAAAGLAVCAAARERGVTAAADWVPLLSRVLLDRELPATAPVPDAAASEARLESDPEPGEPAAPPATGLRAGLKSGVRTLWQLARAFFELQGMLGERPRGNLLARGLAKIPVVGLAGGWLDERGAIAKASERTARLLR